MLPPAASANTLLRCQIEQGGSTRVVEATPTANPYQVRAIDINGRFRFKAVMVGDATHIDYIKLYVYDQSARQPRLLHEARYSTPVAAMPPTFQTGVNYVYAPYLEREMQYQCMLMEITP
ncbi:hypothetical protein QN362_00985 [Actimicrobium sp. CCC2.4]|uniref:hypothetical protein n=1 Tax=Actimicrobium sp. CCC2.4 TaxID=3048606 RepID=UPI002AC998E5|nr:hypothetical protein [Actimicrobium sp. CCC2.4]MEB0133897.1 hypothetical protein [Actimicrobium sp. CCC2.4]WPX31437.1 hypothetical protein RHM62_14465 [Actimicrobium sp. CCC2.4]